MDVFWKLYEKYQRGFARHSERVRLQPGSYLQERLSERDARFLEEVGLPRADDLLGGCCYFAPGAFYEEHMWPGTFLGFLGAWPLLHQAHDTVLVVRPDLNRTFFHANGVAPAVLLPIMVEEASIEIGALLRAWPHDRARRHEEARKIVAALEADMQELDSRLLTEQCFWPYELCRVGCDFGAPPPKLLQGFPASEEELF